MSEPEPAISVVIPAFAASGTIGRCLAGLGAQQDAPPFEAVVVDSSPDDDTGAAVRTALAAAPHLELRYEHLPERAFPGVARNHGARLVRAPLLLFLDADCVPAPDLVRRALGALAGGAAAVSGAIALGGARAPSARLRHLLEFKESLPSCPPRRTWMLPSACLAIRREVFARHGGFPATRAAEDWLLDWTMWRAGEDLRFDPTLEVEHLTQPGWRALWRYSRLLGLHSGAARREGGLPGQLLVRHPALALVALPPGRTLRAVAWCACYARGEIPFLLLFWPAYLALAAVWARGFAAGARGAAAERIALAPERTRP